MIHLNNDMMVLLGMFKTSVVLYVAYLGLNEMPISQEFFQLLMLTGVMMALCTFNKMNEINQAGGAGGTKKKMEKCEASEECRFDMTCRKMGSNTVGMCW